MILWSLLRSLALLLPVAALSLPASQSPSFFYQGHDLSSLQLLEETGSIYKDSARQNATRPAEAILGDGGMNTVRLRYPHQRPSSHNTQAPALTPPKNLGRSARLPIPAPRIQPKLHPLPRLALPQTRLPHLPRLPLQRHLGRPEQAVHPRRVADRAASASEYSPLVRVLDAAVLPRGWRAAEHRVARERDPQRDAVACGAGELEVDAGVGACEEFHELGDAVEGGEGGGERCCGRGRAEAGRDDPLVSRLSFVMAVSDVICSRYRRRMGRGFANDMVRGNYRDRDCFHG